MDVQVVYSPAPGPASGYTQNFVDTHRTAELTSSTYGTNSEPALTLSVWLRPAAVTGTYRFFNQSGRSDAAIIDGKLNIELVDNGANVAYQTTSTNVEFSIGILAHVYIAADFVNDTLVIEIDGVAPTMDANVSTFAPVTNATNFDRLTYFPISGASIGYDGEIADFAVFNSIVSNSLLYNGGTPPDPDAFATTPRVLLGGLMTADERDGNAAQGWNDGYNAGAGGALTVASGTFTDV